VTEIVSGLLVAVDSGAPCVFLCSVEIVLQVNLSSCVGSAPYKMCAELNPFSVRKMTTILSSIFDKNSNKEIFMECKACEVRIVNDPLLQYSMLLFLEWHCSFETVPVFVF